MTKYKHYGYWKSFDNVRQELEKIENELGHYPTTTELENLGYGCLSHAIQKYHGGSNNVRDLLGKDRLRKDRDYWSNFSNIEKEVLDFVDKHGLESLTYTSLKKIGRYDLIHAIKRQGLRLENICQALGLPVLFTPKGYLQDINNVLYEVESLIGKYGCFPSREILRTIGKTTLETAMVRHGGRDKIFEMLKYEHNSKSLLEQSVKAILDKWVEDEYIDNARKILCKYGLDLQNPDTGQYLELDRYYYKARVAIEVQGHQHFRAGGNQVWTEERFKKTVRHDLLKHKMLADQEVTLITIPYNKCSEQDILGQLKCIGKLKLRELGETPAILDNTEPSLDGNIQEGVTTSDEATA